MGPGTDWNSRYEMNELENKFFTAASKKVPDLIPQYEVLGGKYRLDFAKIINLSSDRDLKIAVELDGKEFHSKEEHREKDYTRELDLELDGWRVIRFTGRQVNRNVDDCVDRTVKFIDKLTRDALAEVNRIDPRQDTNGRLILSSLMPDKKSPQNAFLPIIWIATVSPYVNTTLFRFWLNGPSTINAWKDMSGWIKKNKWTWWTTSQDAGRNQIRVEVTDGKYADSGYLDAELITEYIILKPRKRDYYEILGVSNGANPEEIKRNYWNLAKSLHPDKCTEKAKNIWYEEQFKELSEAYETLSDPDRRKLYDIDKGIHKQSTNKPPVITSLIVDQKGPKFPGSTVVWVAQVIDPEGDPIFYRFWLKGPSTSGNWRSMTGWVKENKWGWRITELDIGQCQIRVDVRDGYHAKENGFDSQALSDIIIVESNKPASLISFSSNIIGPQSPGTTIVWTAKTSRGDTAAIYYRFLLRNPLKGNTWMIMRDWGTSNIWTWVPASTDIGDIQVLAQVRAIRSTDPNKCDDFKIVEYKIVRPNKPPVLHSLTADCESPKSPGSTIIWTAKASDPDGDQIYYKFWLKGPSTNYLYQDATSWIKDNRWVWKPTKSDLGSSTIKVEVRDGHHSGSNSYDNYTTEGFCVFRSSKIYWDAIRGYLTNITKHSPKPIAFAMITLVLVILAILVVPGFTTANSPPEIRGFSADQPSLQVAGSTIKWNAKAYDSDNDKLLYRFLLEGPSTGEAWKDMTGWISSDSWSWLTSSDDVGGNQIKVQIRDGNHSSQDGFDAEKIASFTITKMLLVMRSLRPSRPSPQVAGTEITWTAYAHDPAGGRLLYRFSLSSPSTEGRKTLMTDWTADNSWNWATKPIEVGSYQIWVDVKNEGSTDTEAQETESFTLINPPPEELSLEPDKSDPQVYGTTVTWEADASDPNDDTIYYRFLLSGPSTGNAWKIMQTWSTSKTWEWTTDFLDIGDNEVKVQAQDDYSPGTEEFDSEETMSYRIDDQKIIEPPAEIVPVPIQPIGPSNQVNSDEVPLIPEQVEKVPEPSNEPVPQPENPIQPSEHQEENVRKVEPIQLGGDKKHEQTAKIGSY